LGSAKKISEHASNPIHIYLASIKNVDHINYWNGQDAAVPVVRALCNGGTLWGKKEKDQTGVPPLAEEKADLKG